MARYYPVPVTAENFPETWYWVDQYRIRAKKRRVGCIVSLWAGGLSLLWLLLMGASGILYEYGVLPFYDLLRWLPGFEKLWGAMGWLNVLGPGRVWQDFLMMLILLYWLTLAVMALFYGLSQLIYRPKGRPMPEESPKENASALLANARETMEAAAGIHPVGWQIFPICLFLAEFVLLTLCILVAGDPAPILARYMTPSTPLNYLLIFFLPVGGFTAVYGILVYILWSFCRMKLPYSFVAYIECYSFFATEKAGKLTWPELLAKRKAKAAEKCQAALAAEKSGAYAKAAALFLEAAHGGDAAAMEHYARHCLISDSRIPARYWLNRCVSSGEASKNAKKMHRRLKLGMDTGAAYIREPKK